MVIRCLMVEEVLLLLLLVVLLLVLVLLLALLVKQIYFTYTKLEINMQSMFTMFRIRLFV